MRLNRRPLKDRPRLSLLVSRLANVVGVASKTMERERTEGRRRNLAERVRMTTPVCVCEEGKKEVGEERLENMTCNSFTPFLRGCGYGQSKHGVEEKGRNNELSSSRPV